MSVKCRIAPFLVLLAVLLPPGCSAAERAGEASGPYEYAKASKDGIVRALVPGGRVYLVEYRAEDPDVPMLPLHEMSEEQARREMEAAVHVEQSWYAFERQDHPGAEALVAAISTFLECCLDGEHPATAARRARAGKHP